MEFIECQQQSYQRGAESKQRGAGAGAGTAAGGVDFPVKDNDPLLKNDDLSVKDIRISNNQVLGIAFYSFLGFTIIQTTFAIKAKSSAMIADSAAMFVDSATYLFNMIAERLKRREIRQEEQEEYPVTVLEHKLKLERNYLELIPPLISVATLLYVTFVTFGVSIHTLTHSEEENSSTGQGQPNVKVMMFFSIMNLLLDIVNVTCFARVNQAIFVPQFNFENNHHQQQQQQNNIETMTEDSPLLALNIDETLGSTTLETSLGEDDISDADELINLNMCSAWTHVFADTLRSIAVLLAGSVSFFTNVLSPTSADALAALVVSIVIFMSCVPLVRGMAKTLSEIIAMHQSPLMAEYCCWKQGQQEQVVNKNNFEILV